MNNEIPNNHKTLYTEDGLIVTEAAGAMGGIQTWIWTPHLKPLRLTRPTKKDGFIPVIEDPQRKGKTICLVYGRAENCTFDVPIDVESVAGGFFAARIGVPLKQADDPSFASQVLISRLARSATQTEQGVNLDANGMKALQNKEQRAGHRSNELSRGAGCLIVLVFLALPWIIGD